MKSTAGLAVGLVAALCCSDAFAQMVTATETAAIERETWYLEVQPYAWIPVQATGMVAARGMEQDINSDLSDIFDALQFAAAVRPQLWYKDVGLILDGYYAGLGQDRDLPMGGEVKIDVKSFFLETSLGWRVQEWPLGGSPTQSLALNLVGGMRSIFTDVSLDVGPMEVSKSEQLYDPLLGTIIPIQLSPDWLLGLRADISGFGVGTDLTWSFTAGFDWLFSKHAAFKFGYRIMAIDYSNDSSTQDVNLNGPWLGLAFNWAQF